MESRQLKYFLAVVETGTLAAAAQQLYVTDSAISRAIQQLEHVVGAPLFERTPRGMAPTSYGLILARHARHVRAETNRTIEELRELGGGSGGTVVVGCTPSFASVLMPQAASTFYNTRGNARMKVYEGLLDYLIPRLLAGDVDFLVTTLPADPVDPLLEHCKFERSDPAGIIARASHPLAKTKNLRLAQVQNEKWVLSSRPDYLRAFFDRLFIVADLPPLQPLIEIGSIQFLKSFLLKENFLAFLPLQTVHKELQTGELTCLNVKDATIQRQSGVIMRRNAVLSPAAKTLLDIVLQLGADPKIMTQV